MKSHIFISSLIIGLFLLSGMLMAGDKIEASAIPATEQVVVGKTIDIPVTIDVSSFPEKLGSFTATLEWDTEALQYEGHSGGTTLGFESPVVNDMHVKEGKLVFAHAYPYGGEGKVNILNVKMKVVGAEGASSSLQLSFSAMAAAYSFKDLLPNVEVTGGDLELSSKEDVPTKYGIENHPNPFNPSTEIKYELPQLDEVRIVIYNVLGQEVRTLVNGKQEAGRYTVQWNGDNEQGNKVPSGMYFLRMKAGKFIANRKLLLLK
jgi:hypothetical protein